MTGCGPCLFLMPTAHHASYLSLALYACPVRKFRARLPCVSGGGLQLGEVRDYAITLTPGQYVYSCPPDDTPDYRLVVR